MVTAASVADEQHRVHDPERLVPDGLLHLPGRGERERTRHALRRSRGRASSASNAETSSPAAARKSSDSAGDSTPKSVSGACARTTSSTAAVSVPGWRRTRRTRGVGTHDLGAHARDPARVDLHVDAQEALGALTLEFTHIAPQHNLAVVDERDRVAEILDEVELVAREQQVATGGNVLAYDIGEELDRDGIETGEWFVQDEERGLVHHRGGELHALRHATREVLHVVPTAVAESELVEQALRGARPVGLSRPWRRAIHVRRSSTRMSG